MLWKSGKARTTVSRTSLLPLLCLFAFATLVLSFRAVIPGLDAPAPIGAFLNGAFPTQLATDVDVTSTEDFINSALAITPEPLGDRVFVAEQSGRIFTLVPEDDGLGTRSLFMDIGGQVLSGQDSGLAGICFPPGIQ